jgi:hypothetical protein
MMAADEDIRFVTYLSPSIPQAFFEALADHVQRALGHERVSLRVESRASGPQKGDECFSFAEEADVAFMCAPSFVWLRDLRPQPVEPLGVLPVFDDERNRGSLSTSATSWYAATLRSTLSPSSKEARGRTTTPAR